MSGYVSLLRVDAIDKLLIQLILLNLATNDSVYSLLQSKQQYCGNKIKKFKLGYMTNNITQLHADKVNEANWQ